MNGLDHLREHKGKNWKLITAITVIVIILVGLIFEVISSRWLGGSGAGVNESISITTEIDSQGNIVKKTETITSQPRKSLWDLFDLAGMPLVLLGLGFWFQYDQRKRSEAAAKSQKEIADSEAREEILQIYFDRLSILLIDKNILAFAEKLLDCGELPLEERRLLDGSLNVIRARTFSILRRFENDKQRKSSVIRFLAETKIITKARLNLSGVDLSEVNLSGVDLSGAILVGANLSGAVLNETNLSEAQLEGAYLRKAQLRKANLSKANLSRGTLTETDLYKANLVEAILVKANLSLSCFKEANLSKSNLIGAILADVTLEKANLQDIKFDAKAFCFSRKDIIKKAVNIPNSLKKQFGINQV